MLSYNCATTILYIKIIVWWLYNQGKSSITWESHISEIDLEQKHGVKWSKEASLNISAFELRKVCLAKAEYLLCTAIHSILEHMCRCLELYRCLHFDKGAHTQLYRQTHNLTISRNHRNRKAYRVKRSRAYYSCRIILVAVSGDLHVLFSQKLIFDYEHTPLTPTSKVIQKHTLTATLTAFSQCCKSFSVACFWFMTTWGYVHHKHMDGWPYVWTRLCCIPTKRFKD